MTEKKAARRMSSQSVRIGMVGALSLTVAACASNNVTANCVDRSSYRSDGSYRTVDDRYCDNNGYYGSHGGYFWYYGGRRSGSRILKGTTVKPKNATITSAKGKTIQRGGFGGRSSHSGS